MKYAVIDIGTNTVLLLIVEREKGFRDVLDMSTVVKLGENLVNSGKLSGAAMSRTLEALKRYFHIAASHNVAEIFCVGTAALREASNSIEFLADVKEALGLDVEVISGEKEAYYTYLSVRDDPRIKGNSMTIVDIGGGSTEIINGSGNDIQGYASLPMGSVKITDAFITCDPPRKEELGMAASYIRDNLSRVTYREGSILVGTGGTVTNIAAMVLGLEEYDKERIHGLPVEFSRLEGLMEELTVLTSDRRKMIKGMEQGREDIILQGALILKETMAHGRFKRCVVSTKGVRYGVVYEKCR